MKDFLPCELLTNHCLLLPDELILLQELHHAAREQSMQVVHGEVAIANNEVQGSSTIPEDELSLGILRKEDLDWMVLTSFVLVFSSLGFVFLATQASRFSGQFSSVQSLLFSHSAPSLYLPVSLPSLIFTHLPNGQPCTAREVWILTSMLIS